jgi:UDP-glucose 4-epimerase
VKPQRSSVLVTGGAGYIGSHVVLQLVEAGHRVVVYDNLSTGFPWAVLGGELVVGDLADRARLSELFEKHKFGSVLHFAAHIIVPESVAKPLKYYGNNTRNTLGLIETCIEFGVKNFVFSSTAAVYGVPETMPITEDTPLKPINPYGASKMMSERMLIDAAAVSTMRYVILRYFNVAGADEAGRIGQATAEATHLIKIACQVAVGLRPALTIFGTDYPTPDGTCIRDYVHVVDLARAHLDALVYLSGGGTSAILNCGYQRGTSVMEIVDVVRKVSGAPLAVSFGDRRAGDPPALVAGNERIKATLGWRPRHDDLEGIVGSAWRWEKLLAERNRKAAAAS